MHVAGVITAGLQIEVPEVTRAAAQTRAVADGFPSVDVYIARLIQSDTLAVLRFVERGDATLTNGAEISSRFAINPV